MSDLELFALIPPGGTLMDIPPEIRKKRGIRVDIFKDRYAKLHPDRPSRTLVAHMSVGTTDYIYPVMSDRPEDQRSISVREAARLQSFPDCFVFPRQITHAFRLIGNSVPPLLSFHLACAATLHFNEFS